MADIAWLVAKLGWSDPEARLDAAVALDNADSMGADITAAMPALANALKDKNEEVRNRVVWTLRLAAGRGTDMAGALPVLARELFDKSEDVRAKAGWVLEGVVMKCSQEQLRGLEAMVMGEFRAFRKTRKGRGNGGLAGTGAAFFGVMNEIASKRNALASNRDILLDGKPKPPKGRGTKIYQEIRRVRNG